MASVICLPVVLRSFDCTSSLPWRYPECLGLSSAHGVQANHRNFLMHVNCALLLPHLLSITFLIFLISFAFTLLASPRLSVLLILIITFFLLQYSSQRVLLKTIVRTYNHHIRGRSVIRITWFDCLWRQNQSFVVGSPPSSRILHSTVIFALHQISWINKTNPGSLAPLAASSISPIGEVHLS